MMTSSNICNFVCKTSGARIACVKCYLTVTFELFELFLTPVRTGFVGESFSVSFELSKISFSSDNTEVAWSKPFCLLAFSSQSLGY